MRFRNGKKSFGLIAVLSCVLTATVAFAAYTGYNYINGQTEIMGNPFKMVFVDTSGNEIGAPYELSSSDYATTVGNAELSESITVSPNGSTINDFKVKLYQHGDSATYTLTLKNTGGSTAYLSAVDIAETTMPADSEGTPVSGLDYTFSLTGVDSSGTDASFTRMSVDGAALPDDHPVSGEYIAVEAGAPVSVNLTVTATSESLFSGGENTTLDMGTITITWSAVDPSQANT